MSCKSSTTLAADTLHKVFPGKHALNDTPVTAADRNSRRTHVIHPSFTSLEMFLSLHRCTHHFTMEQVQNLTPTLPGLNQWQQFSMSALHLVTTDCLSCSLAILDPRVGCTIEKLYRLSQSADACIASSNVNTRLLQKLLSYILAHMHLFRAKIFVRRICLYSTTPKPFFFIHLCLTFTSDAKTPDTIDTSAV